MPVSAAVSDHPAAALPGAAIKFPMSRSLGVSMDSSTRKHARSGAFDRSGLAAFLTQRHAVKTAAAVAAQGIAPVRTVQHWLAGTATPSAAAFARLVAAYGPALLAASVPGLSWVERAAQLAEREGIAREIARLESRLAATAVRLESGP